MNNKDIKYYIIIVIVVTIFSVLSFIVPLEPLSKWITTVTTLIAAVAFWLQFKRSQELNEASFIMNLNNQFISNSDLTQVEHELELYFNLYENYSIINTNISVNQLQEIHLGLSQSRTSDDCQKQINYLVYLEALAALVDREVIHLKVIDDLFSYRFFLAVNNPVIQEGELFPYADYYQGIYRLTKRWVEAHKKMQIPIPMERFCLSEERLNKWKEGERCLKLDISIAQGDDNKLQIAKCLYGTDSYIYPDAFGEDSSKAIKIISRIIGMENCLLDYKNFILARYNGEVCGICLVTDGKYTWDIDLIKKRIGEDLMPEYMMSGFYHASKEYFTSFFDLNNNEIELVACCVDKGYRRKQVAISMLKELVRQYEDRIIRLAVLCDNSTAIQLYEYLGFSIVKKEKGFAPEGLQKPWCFIMKRTPGLDVEKKNAYQELDGPIYATMLDLP